MKKYFFTFMLPVVMMLGLLSSCQSIFPPKMTMITTANRVSLILAGEGNVTIDWGDGTPNDKGTLGVGVTSYKHSYSSSSTRTITITGKNVIELSCAHNQLTSLNVGKNKVLKELDCSLNKLTSLDVSKNKVLEYLYCFGNELTSLDVSKNNVLEVLFCGGNELASLDVSNNNVLKVLLCEWNQLISLDVSNNNVLKELNCSRNKLTSTALNALFSTLHSNTIEEKKIEIGNNSGESDCNISIAESKGWRIVGREMTMKTTASKVEFKLAGKGEVTINWRDGTANNKGTLEDNFISYTHSYSSSSNHTITITSANITMLDCSRNQLTSLDVSNNKVLEKLYCSDNKLTSLDVSNNKELKELDCLSNELTSLDVGNNTALIYLDCSYNFLTSLDVSNNKELKHLDCNGNKLTSTALNALFGTLNSNTTISKYIIIYNNPGEDDCNLNIAKNKRWEFFDPRGAIKADDYFDEEDDSDEP